MTRKLTKEQRDEMRRKAKLDMNDAYYLTHRGSMEAILTLLDDLDEADRELGELFPNLWKEVHELRAKLAEVERVNAIFIRERAEANSRNAALEAKLAEADAIIATVPFIKTTSHQLSDDAKRELETLRAVERAARDVFRLSDREQNPWLELKDAFAAVDALRSKP